MTSPTQLTPNITYIPSIHDGNPFIYWLSNIKYSIATSMKSDVPCRYFQLGTCSRGSLCRFSHSATTSKPVTMTNFDESLSINFSGLDIREASKPEEAGCPFKYNEALGTVTSSTFNVAPVSTSLTITVVPENRKELCIFAITGKCRYGPMCRSVHGIQCPRCLKFCLHPDDVDQNEEHIQQCLDSPSATCLTSEEDSRIECGICFDQVLGKADPRFGLLNCEHAFCISCIRTWRSKYTMDSDNLRSCPLCRTTTYFVIPSSIWISDPTEKSAVIENYKKKLSEIPCKHYSKGAAACPFGTSCFYSHAKDDGTVDKPSLRTVVGGNEKVNVYRETRLSDFIVFKQPNHRT